MPTSQAAGARNLRSAFGLAAAKHQHRRADRDERRQRPGVGQRGDRGQRDQAREHRGDDRGEDGDPDRRPAVRDTRARLLGSSPSRATVKKIRLWP